MPLSNTLIERQASEASDAERAIAGEISRAATALGELLGSRQFRQLSLGEQESQQRIAATAIVGTTKDGVVQLHHVMHLMESMVKHRWPDPLKEFLSEYKADLDRPTTVTPDIVIDETQDGKHE